MEGPLFSLAAPRGLRGHGNMARQVSQYFTGGDGDQRQFKVSGFKFKVNGQGKTVSSFRFQVQS